MSQELPFPAPRHPANNLITILSIDGGGIRGIIPGVILEYLETKLQDIEGNKKAKLADYFDVIAGTSTGGLVTTMLTTPKEPGSEEAKYAAKDIVPFYLKNAPKIFKQPQNLSAHTRSGLGEHYVESTHGLTDYLPGPLYDGEDLRSIVNEFLGMETRLSDTLTNVVIPAYDIRSIRPVIFSSFKERRDDIDVSMHDICIATTAAPVYLPGHNFYVVNPRDIMRLQVFNLIDGGVVANNPTAIALEEVMVDVMKDLDDCNTMRHPCGQFLVLSLGTGSSKNAMSKAKYDLTMGGVGWLASTNPPLIQIFMQASADLVDYRINNIFHIPRNREKFLRIQDDTLTGDLASVHKATDKNLKDLKEVGRNLLKKPLCRTNFMTGEFEPVENGGTNSDALDRFAILLKSERDRRVRNNMGDLATKKASVIRLLKQNMGIYE